MKMKRGCGAKSGYGVSLPIQIPMGTSDSKRKQMKIRIPDSISGVFFHKVLSVCVVALFAFSACHRPEPAPDNQVFRYNEAGNLLSLDPAFARLQSGVWACRQVFSGWSAWTPMPM